MDQSLEVFYALMEVRRRVWFTRGMASPKATQMIQQLADTESKNNGENFEDIVQEIEKWIHQETNRLRMGSDIDVENYVTVKIWIASNENPSPTVEAEWLKNWRQNPAKQTYHSEQRSELISAANSLYGLLTDQHIVNMQPEAPNVHESVMQLTPIEQQRREWFRRGMVSKTAVSMIDNLLRLENKPDSYNEIVEWIRDERRRLEVEGTSTDKDNLQAIMQWSDTHSNPPFYSLGKGEWFPAWVFDKTNTVHGLPAQTARNRVESPATTSNVARGFSDVGSYKSALERLIEAQRREWFSRGMVSEAARSMIDHLILLEGTAESRHLISLSMREIIHKWIKGEQNRLLNGSKEDKKHLKALTKWAGGNKNPSYDRRDEWFDAHILASSTGIPVNVQQKELLPLAVGLTTDKHGRDYIDVGDQMPDELYKDIIEAQRRIWFSRGLCCLENDYYTSSLRDNYYTAWTFLRTVEYHEGNHHSRYGDLCRWVGKEAERLQNGTIVDSLNLRRVRQWRKDEIRREEKKAKLLNRKTIIPNPLESTTWYDGWKPSNAEYINALEDSLLKKHPGRPIIVPWRPASEPLTISSLISTATASSVHQPTTKLSHNATAATSNINHQADSILSSPEASANETTAATASRTLENTPTQSDGNASEDATPFTSLVRRKRPSSNPTCTDIPTKKARPPCTCTK